jgi:hypothetical protein
MIEDVFNQFGEWFFDEINSEDFPFSENLDLSSNSSETYFDENSSDISDDLGDNMLAEEQPNFDFVTEVPELDNFVTDESSYLSAFSGLGNPENDAQFWQQQEGQNSCAVVAQISVFESITGQEISEEQACEIAQANGWFNPENGTYPDDVGKLLNELGIPTEQQYDASLDDIADALEKGDRVIVALDANEIWNPLRDADGMPIEQTNGGHAVWVTGIETNPDGSVKIILNDSGHPNGKMTTVDALDFVNAWQDHGNFLVVADAPNTTILA